MHGGRHHQLDSVLFSASLLNTGFLYRTFPPNYMRLYNQLITKCVWITVYACVCTYMFC